MITLDGIKAQWEAVLALPDGPLSENQERIALVFHCNCAENIAWLIAEVERLTPKGGELREMFAPLMNHLVEAQRLQDVISEAVEKEKEQA